MKPKAILTQKDFSNLQVMIPSRRRRPIFLFFSIFFSPQKIRTADELSAAQTSTQRLGVLPPPVCPGNSKEGDLAEAVLVLLRHVISVQEVGGIVNSVVHDDDAYRYRAQGGAKGVGCFVL